ncbi:MAG: hypothetical protein RL263_966 [Bacteroidota bacterium]|jgi:myo-inositol-1(or 4)-monophosphatase
MSNFANLLPEVLKLCKEVGEFQLQHLQKVGLEAIEEKTANQLVSFVDKNSEQMLVDGLKTLLPNSTIIGEESAPENRTLTSETWIIDPLDGTTNFLHGLPVFSISVALFVDGQPHLAVVECPALKESFTAALGKGAWLNGEPIAVATNPDLKNSLIATGFPYYTFGKMSEYLELLEVFMRSTQGLRRMGSAAIDLAYVACGRFDAFFEMNLSPWDIAAGILLVREAGGQVTDFHGKEDIVFDQEIIAASSAIYDTFTKEVALKLG